MNRAAAGADRGLYLVFDWAEYELCEILRTHRDRGMKPPAERMVKSIMWQASLVHRTRVRNRIRNATRAVSNSNQFEFKPVSKPLEAFTKELE